MTRITRGGRFQHESSPLAKLREARGLSQEDLAIMLHRTVQTVSRLENGHLGLSGGLALSLAAALKTSRKRVVRAYQGTRSLALAAASEAEVRRP